jgi:hypothetical protein
MTPHVAHACKQRSFVNAFERLEAVLGYFLFQIAKSSNGTCSKKEVQVEDVSLVIAHEVATAAGDCFVEMSLMFVYFCEAVF